MTDLCGQIRFFGPSARRLETAQYIRVNGKGDRKTPCKPVLEKILSENDWNVPPPNIVISVTGGASQFRFDSQLKDAFGAGLVKMASNSGAWVVTGGEHSGVMKLTGQALAHCRSEEGHSVPCIGICTWGRVHMKDTLTVDAETLYDSSSKSGKKNITPLDPNHSHFVFVDDGIESDSPKRTHQPWHGEFNKAIQNYDFEHNIKVPVVTVLVNGGKGSLDTVRESLEKRVPVVVVKGSGRCADALAFIMDSAIREMRADGNYDLTWTEADDEAIYRCIKDTFTSENDLRTKTETGDIFNRKAVEDLVDDLKTLVKTGLESKDSPLLAVYDAFGKSQSSLHRELDYVVLMLVFRSSKHVQDSVDLALGWNRADIVRDELLSLALNVEKVTNEKWAKFMDKALENELHEFVRVFINEGLVDMGKYVTTEKLEGLYLIQMPVNAANQLQERDRNNILAKYGLSSTPTNGSQGKRYHRLSPTPGPTSGSQEDLFISSSGNEDEGFHTLFLWALLTARWEVAEVLWSYCREPIAAALAASVVLRAWSKRVRGHSVHVEWWTELKEQRRKWAQRALDLFSIYYEQDPEEAAKLIVRRADHWGEQHLLKLAAESKNMNFIAHECVQKHLTEQWMGGIDTTTSTWKILSSIIFFPLVSWLIDVDKQDGEDETPNDMGRKVTTSERFATFYCSPVLKFWLYLFAYSLFLCFFSYSLMVRWKPNSLTGPDGVTLLWVVAILLEDLYQMYMTKPKALSIFRFCTDLLSSFNAFAFIKVFAFLLYFAGFVVRVAVPHDDDDEYPLNFRWARMLLSIDICLFFIRGMELSFLNSHMGPKLTMIYKMIVDFLLFVGIIFISLVAYGVAVQALLYPLADPSWSLLRNILYMPYWQIYGELFLDDFDGPAAIRHEPLAIILLAAYLLFTNILLLNLLIAIFNNTYERVANEADSLWKFQRYLMVTTFKLKTIVPPPFNWVEIIVRIVLSVCCGDEVDDGQSSEMEMKKRRADEIIEAKRLEGRCMEIYAGRVRDSE